MRLTILDKTLVTLRDVKGGIPQNTSWRLGGGEVLQTLKNEKAVPDATDTRIEIAYGV